MDLLATHARSKGGQDDIFNYGQIARAREAEVGKEAIINATVGAFLDDNGALKTFRTVEEAMAAVPFNRLANYAPIDGLPQFVTHMTDHVLRGQRPTAYIGGIATPGGTGGLHSAFYNYLERGEACLAGTPCWSNYTTLLSETGRTLITFDLFNGAGTFNLAACEAACRDVATRQRNVMLVLNTPAHNPTGYALSEGEWQGLMAMLRAIADNGTNNVILVLDVAYIDYAAPEDRQFFSHFADLPENFLVIVCASASKSFTLYGFRLGLMIAIAQSQQVLDAFIKANNATARATWSNGSRPAMETLITIFEEPKRHRAFLAEQQAFAEKLHNRARSFTQEAAAAGLKLVPYRSGFFIYIPTADHNEAVALVEAVRAHEIYVVPLGDGVRIAICAIADHKIQGMATVFAEALQAIRSKE